MHKQRPDFLHSKNNNDSGISSEIIGYSERGRPLVVGYYGCRNPDDKTQRVRIFILAGQHGDEPYGRKAVGELVSVLLANHDGGDNEDDDTKNNNGSHPRGLQSLQIAILQNANPDGASMRSRTNANGIDLNRDHQFLNAVETRLTHSFISRWRPHMVIDVHNYPSKRKHLLRKGLILHHDVFIDVPTSPSVFTNLYMDQKMLDQFLCKVKADLQLHGFSCERYCMIKPSGRVRHSTPDVIDARNFLALRYNAMTVLLEGRAPTREDGKRQRELLIAAQLQALLSVLAWSAQNKGYLYGIHEYIPSKGERVPVQSRYSTARQPLKMSFKSLQSGSIEALSLPNYTPHIEISKCVQLPDAYAVPRENKKLLDVLHGHGFASLPPGRIIINGERIVQDYFIQSVKKRKNRLRVRSFTSAREAGQEEGIMSFCDDDRYEIFPVRQLGGHSLAVLLEPKSKYGLHRNKGSGLFLLSKNYYPILRVV